MPEIVAIDGRWYAPLLRPVLSTVSPAMAQLERESPGDPWAVPRAGLGGALVLQVSRGFGRRAGRRAERITVAAFEAYNQRLHVGEPSDEERVRWLAQDLKWAQKAWRSLVEHDGPAVARVLDRLFGPEVRSGDHEIPEAVLFLRGAVAAGVVLGDVSGAVHETLDRHVTWLGLSWEAQRGTLNAAGWKGALAALDMDQGEPFPDTPEPVARARAAAALDKLPPLPAVELLLGVLHAAPCEERPMARSPRAWTPMAVPELEGPRVSRARAPGTVPVGGSVGGSVVDELRRRWGPAVETELAALTRSRSTTFASAADYLRCQGGKRVRPLLALAAAEACLGAEGGEPRRALPLAAAVEWLHQGTLVLDDIIDTAQLRRGEQALHRATSEVFASGIALFVFARVVRSGEGAHPDIRRRVVETAVALAEGERLELLHTGDGDLSMTDYYRIIEAKTARLFGCAASLGALCVEAPRARVRALARFGRELGLAFQIVDDLLDYSGQEARLGKRPGTDLRAAKMTLPLLLLREALTDAGDRQRLRDALGRAEELAWVNARLADRGIIEACRERAAKHSRQAIAALDALPEGPHRDTLAALAHELGARRC